MKKLFYLFVCMLCVLCAACDRKYTEPTEYPVDPDSVSEPQLAIIRLSAGMEKQVFVSPAVDSAVMDNSKTNLTTLYYGDKLVLCNPTQTDSLLADFALSQLKITGITPYIKLDNEHAIIDWKWANFHPLSGAGRRPVYSSPKIYDNKKALSGYSTNFHYMNGRLANEEYYLLDTQWQDLTDLTAEWTLTEGQRTEMPEVRYINLKDIEKYGDYKESYKILFLVSADLNYVYQSYLREPEKFKAYSEELDRAQASYAETLKQIIKNNELETLTVSYRQ